MRNKSEENWSVGQRCLQQGDFNAAANRLYYSVFQAVLYFAKKKLMYVPNRSEGRAHARMAHVAASRGSEIYGRAFKRLMGLRETADYEAETPAGGMILKISQESDAVRNFFLNEADKP